MLSDVAARSEAALRALGFRLRSRHGETWELVLPNARTATRVLRGDRGRITLSEARKRGDRPDGARTLLVAPSASPGVLDAAAMGRWDLLLWEQPRAVVNGVDYAAIGSGAVADAPRRADRDARAGAAAGVGTGAAAGAGVGARAGVVTAAGAPVLDGVGPDAAVPDAAVADGPVPDAAVPGGTVPDDSAPDADADASRDARSGGRRPWVRWGLARLLLLDGPAPVGQLADRLGTSPQSVRRSAGQWGELLTRGADGRWSTPDVAALRSAWEAAYPGPGGTARGWWHPLPEAAQAAAAARYCQSAGAQPLLLPHDDVDPGAGGHGDGGPGDGAVSASLYVRHDVDLRAAGFVPAPLERATLRVVVPRDPTPWATARPALVAGQPVVVLDPLLASACRA